MSAAQLKKGLPRAGLSDDIRNAFGSLDVERLREYTGVQAAPAEKRKIEMLVSGCTVEEIGRTLGIGLTAVRVGTQRIFAKFGVHTRGDLAVLVVGCGAIAVTPVTGRRDIA